MKRRNAIKNIGLTFGAVAATPGMLSLLQSCTTKEIPWMPAFFTEEEGKVIRMLVDTFLPAVENLPSATEVNVHVFIDKYINEVMELWKQKKNRESMDITIKKLLADSGSETVEDLKALDYESFLDANLKKKTSEDSQISNFLTELRGLAIRAYKTNERVGETILAYKPVPGEQKGCVDLQEATGGIVWSL